MFFNKNSFWFSILIFFTITFCCNKIIAQNNEAFTEDITFESFTNKNGLSQGFVSCILQDKEGLMWFATKDGLNKYDGYHVTVFRNNPADPYSLPENYVTKLAEDDNGNFWLSTNSKGLCLFDRKTERFYRVKLNAADTLVINTMEYIECKNGLLFTADFIDCCLYNISQIHPGNYNDAAFATIKKVFSINNQAIQLKTRIYNTVSSMNWMDDNSLWYYYTDSVSIFRPDAKMKSWSCEKKSLTSFGLQTNTFYLASPVKDKQQILFFSADGLYIYDLQLKCLVYTKLFDSDERILDKYIWTKSFLDKNGNLIIRLTQNTYSFNPYTHSFKKLVIAKNQTRTFDLFYTYSDNDGVVWLGTNGFGITIYNNRREQFNRYNERCLAFNEDLQHNMYMRFNPAGCCRFDLTNKLKKPLVPENIWNKKWDLSASYVICTDNNGVLWIRSSDIKTKRELLVRYNSANQTIEEHTDLLSKETDIASSKFFTDHKNDLWQMAPSADFSRKLIHSDGITFKQKAIYNMPVKKHANTQYLFISSLWQDPNDVFWFGTLQGLLSFDERKNEWHSFKNNPTDSSSLSSDVIFSVCPDPKFPDKYLWVGTNGGGLNRFEFATGKCIRYDDKDGLPNNVVYGILSDDFGNLWLSTNQGLSCFTPYYADTKEKSVAKNNPIGDKVMGSFKNYTDEDGLSGNEFNRYEFFKSKSGEFFYGGVDGITWFNPATVLKSILPAKKIILTGLSVFNKPVSYKTDSSIIKDPIQYAQTITLPYDKDMFSIEFALLQYASSDKKHYRYIMDGFDKGWIDNGTKNTATFTNLDPGEYTFHVTGSNSDGVWNETGVSIKIIITPPWWATWWFRILVAVAVAVTIYLVYRYRLKQALKLQKIRNRIASDLHDDIGSALSSISMFGEVARKNLNSKPNETGMLLDQINESTTEMMESMSDIVWSINTSNDKLGDVINRMRAFAVQVLEAKQIKLQMHVADELKSTSLDMVQRKNIYLIFKEAINNIVKYADCKNVLIDISLTDNKKMVMRIKDDGKGLSTTTLENGQKAKQNFGGNGIVNMKKRANELNGDLSITSKTNEGICIELSLKI